MEKNVKYALPSVDKIVIIKTTTKKGTPHETLLFPSRSCLAHPLAHRGEHLMKRPISIIEQRERLFQEFNRVADTRETVLDRINRGGYTLHSREGRAIMRKAGRMAERMARIETELQNLKGAS